MAAEMKADYMVDNGTDFDKINFSTTAEQVSFTNGDGTKSNVQDAVTQLNDDLDTVANSPVLSKGTSSVGADKKPIYLKSGVPTAFSSTVGSRERGTDRGIYQPVYMNAGTITACGLRIAVGTVIRNTNSITTSVTVFTTSELNALLGVSGSNVSNTVCFFANGDGGAQDVHIEGSTLIGSEWKAVFNKNPADGRLRINYLVAYSG